MKNSMAKNNLSELAQYGRNNDTEIAKTSMGELWHVTKDEKRVMDMFGMEGEKLVDAVGSGTTNPMTGLEEKDPFLIGSLIVGGIGAMTSGRTAELQSSAEKKMALDGINAVIESISRRKKLKEGQLQEAALNFSLEADKQAQQTNVAKTDLTKGTMRALEQAGLATAGSVTSEDSMSWKRLRDSYGSASDSLLARFGKAMGDIHGSYEADIVKLESEKKKLELTADAASKREKSWYLGKNLMKAGRYIGSKFGG